MKWISVKDKLPEQDVWIIYHAPGLLGSDSSPQMWIGKYDGSTYSRSGFYSGKVTHWMYAPMLPEVEGSSNEPKN